MQQLSGMDSAFLAAESTRTPMHVTAVLVYEPPPRHGDVLLFDTIRDHFNSSLGHSPIFRRKLTQAPMRYDHPYWVDADDFDIDDHLHHHVLPQPGDWEQFRDTAGRIHSTGLDMQRPLWEAHVIDGLDGIDGLPAGSFGIVIKLHHAAIDGVSGTRILAALHSTSPDEQFRSSTPDWVPGTAPSRMEMMWNSYRNYRKRPAALWRTIRDVAPALRSSGTAAADKPKLLQKTKTRFNTGVTERRVFDALALELDRVRSLRALAPGCTVNDVVVAIVGGGLRRYLNDKRELPEASLVAGAPINTRGKGDGGAAGNQISMMRIPLCTDIDDPVDRLAAVHNGARSSKTFARNVGTRTIADLAQNINPQLLVLGIRAVSSETLKDLIAAPVHTVVSNVPGPKSDMYLGGARVQRVIGLGPLIDQVGLFHSVTSAGNSMAISFVSCKEAMPDPDCYRECLRASYAEMLDRVS